MGISETSVHLPDHSLNNLDAIIRQEGGHFFSPSSMKFFHSRVSYRVYPTYGHQGTYFVTSERQEFLPEYPRLYTVRRAYWVYKNGRKKLVTETIGEFQQYGTAETAHKYAKQFAAKYKHPMIELLRTAGEDD
jgi:hypothetical protein